MKHLYILLAFSLFCLGASAQSGTIYFSGGTLTVQPNSQNAEKVFAAIDGLKNQKAFYVQFQSSLSAEQLEEISNAGFSFAGYVPDNTYLFFAGSGSKVEILSRHGLRHIGEIPHSAKLHSQLRDFENIPFYAKAASSGKVMIRLATYSGFELPEIKSELERRSFEVKSIESSFIEMEVNYSRLTDLAKLNFVAFIDLAKAPDVADDREARSLHRSSAINGPLSGDRKYDGRGIGVAIADDGDVSHIDFNGRLTDLARAGGGTHGDMTAGICVGAGNVDERATGHATGAHLILYDIGGYGHVINSVNYFRTRGTFVTSTSYSQGQGGVYTADTRDIDRWSRTEPRLLHVFSAGNSGNSNGGSGYPQGWGNITGGYKAGKNVIASGNLNDRDVLESSSSRGPAEDGRIKPELCANGFNQNSTGPNNTYRLGGGTSAAAPSIAGVVVQLYHAYNVVSGGDTAEAALIKGALLNTAEDLGRPGPDFEHGWGRINGLKAARTLENNWYESRNITTADLDTFELTVPAGTGKMSVMIHWTDYEGSTTAARTLVNDIDLLVVDSVGNISRPLVLDHTPVVANLRTNAVPGTDSINNAEQIVIDLPYAGKYKVIVSGKNIPLGPQKYYMLYYFEKGSVELTWPNGGEGLIPGFAEVIRWDAPQNLGTFTIQHSADSGKTFTTIGSAPATSRFFQWTAPVAAPGGNNLIRIERNGVADTSDNTFALLGRPGSLSVDTVCPSEVSLSWNAVNGADRYIIYRLGTKYMDSIASTTNTSASVPGINPLAEQWYSVSAVADNRVGIRALGLQYPGGLLNCVVAQDVEVTAFLNSKRSYQICREKADSVHMEVSITNSGVDTVRDLPLVYSINNGPQKLDTLKGSLLPSASSNFVFRYAEDFSVPGSYSIVAWTDYILDQNPWNDTMRFEINTVQGTSNTVPFSESFDNMNNCATATNCGATVCPLSNGWVNPENGSEDDIDWRVHNGGTQSQGTGPSVDHTTGTNNGKYIYLEASNGCTFEEALLISPCVDLVNVVVPEFSFWYHMSGTAVGQLHVDLLTSDTTILDIIPALNGTQGNAWRNLVVDLSAYKGKTINIRMRGITGNDWSSDIALDDLEFQDGFRSNFTYSGKLCKDSIVVFRDASLSGPGISHGWDFGLNGTPMTATGPGPHQVAFSTVGNQNITKTILDSVSGKKDTSSISVSIGEKPDSRFGLNVTGNIVSFNDSSSRGLFWFWQFGDGTTSNARNPIHTYPQNGNYTVNLIVSNACGADTFTRNVRLNVGLEDLFEAKQVQIYPNPTKANATIEISDLPAMKLQLSVEDLLGRSIQNYSLEHLGGSFNQQLNLSSLSSGMYILRLRSEQQESKFKITVNK